MENNSIEEFKEHLGDYLNTLDIPIIDKVELLINLIHFLSNYEENIQVLEKHRVLKLKDKD